MVKKIDTSLIERIRQAAVEIISEHGITGSSVAAIAKRAQVSAGYLYRHYPSKEDLVNDLLNEALHTIAAKIDELIQQNDRIENIVQGIILESAEANPHRIKFMIMLLSDFSIPNKPSVREQIIRIGETLIQKGRESGSIRKEITIEDFYIALVGIPLQYLATKFRFNFGPQQRDLAAETRKISELSMCAIK